jgi:hypothetical protein
MVQQITKAVSPELEENCFILRPNWRMALKMMNAQKYYPIISKEKENNIFSNG